MEMELPPFSEEEVEKFYSFGFAHYGSGNWAKAAELFVGVFVDAFQKSD